MMTRRSFTQRALSALFTTLTVAPALTLTGCNAIADLIAYIPWITRALNAISSILGSFMPPPANIILNIIKGGLADLQAAAVEYQNSPAASKATFLARVHTFLADVVDNFQAFLDALAINGTIIDVIVGIVNVVLSTLGWLGGAIPPAPAGFAVRAMQMPVTLRAGQQMLYVSPVQRSIKQFRDDFDTVVAAAGHPEQEM